MCNAENCANLEDAKRKFVKLFGSNVPNFWKELAKWLIEEANA